MAQGQEEEADKSHEPTRHKLEQARKKGELARSADLNTAAAYAGFLLAALLAGAASVDTMGTVMVVLIGQAEPLSDLVFSGAASAPVGGIIGTVVTACLAWFLAPAALALLSALIQRSVVFAPSKLTPKMSRIDPVQNAKNKFGASGLFEFAKSFAKLFLYSVLLAFFLGYRFPEMAGSLHAEPAVIAALMGWTLVEFLCVVLAIAICIGGIDYMWQYHDHMRKNRMSHREMREEHKKHEGDPHLKQERRQRGMQIASRQMMADVPGADVVIVNPTHYAVALKWSRAEGSAPVCVAKGVDHIAYAIRECAIEHGVPIQQDPPTARALFASTEIGDQIDPRHYRAVAAAIRFSEAMRRRARSRS